MLTRLVLANRRRIAVIGVMGVIAQSTVFANHPESLTNTLAQNNPLQNRQQSTESLEDTAITDSNSKRKIVITGSRRITPKAEDVNPSLIDDSQLHTVKATHPSEWSFRIPGLWISRGNGQEHLTAIRSPVFTGPGSCGEFTVLENGIPLRAKGFCNVNQLFEAPYEFADQIHVHRGPQAALYGSGAIHGLMNFQVQSASTDSQSIRFETSRDDFYRVTTDSNWVDDKQYWRLQMTGLHDGGYQDQSGVDQQKILLRHESFINDWNIESQLTFINLNQETAGYLQASENSYQETSLLRNNDFPEAYRDASALRAYTRITRLTENGQWQLTPHVRRHEMDFLMHFLPGQPTEYNEHKGVGLHWQVDDRLRDDWLLQYGVDTEVTKGSLQQYQTRPTATGSAFLNAVLPVGQHYNFNVKALSAGVWTNINKTFDDDLHLLAGFRFDSMHYQYDNQMLDGNTRDDGTPCGFGGCRYTRPADRNDSFAEPSATVSLIGDINDHQQWRLKLDRAFRHPEATELYRLQNGQTATDIESQKALSLELGWQWQNDNKQFSVSAFQMKKHDVIFQNSDREWVSGARTTHKGIEWQWQQSINERWTWRWNATWAKHQYDNNVALSGSSTTELIGNTIDTAPEIISGMTILWSPFESWKSEWEWVYLDDYFLNPENSENYSGHSLLHWRLSKTVNQNWQWQLQIHNVLDERYAERADFAFGNHRYFVGQPTRLLLSFEYRTP